jgi:hypothetical protein
MPPEGVFVNEAVVEYVSDVEFYLDGVSYGDVMYLLCWQVMPGVFRVLEA